MSDPHLNDPRYSDPPLIDPVLRRDESIGGPQSWIAGVAEVLLIAFMVIVGWHSSRNNTASSSAPATSGSAMWQIDPPSTTGSGAGSPQPLTPARNAVDTARRRDQVTLRSGAPPDAVSAARPPGAPYFAALGMNASPIIRRWRTARSRPWR